MRDISYPVRLCIEMMYYAVHLSDKTQEMKSSDIRQALGAFFNDAVIDEAVNILLRRDA